MAPTITWYPCQHLVEILSRGELDEGPPPDGTRITRARCEQHLKSRSGADPAQWVDGSQRRLRHLPDLVSPPMKRRRADSLGHSIRVLRRHLSPARDVGIKSFGLLDLAMWSRRSSTTTCTPGRAWTPSSTGPQSLTQPALERPHRARILRRVAEIERRVQSTQRWGRMPSLHCFRSSIQSPTTRVRGQTKP